MELCQFTPVESFPHWSYWCKTSASEVRLGAPTCSWDRPLVRQEHICSHRPCSCEPLWEWITWGSADGSFFLLWPFCGVDELFGFLKKWDNMGATHWQGCKVSSHQSSKNGADLDFFSLIPAVLLYSKAWVWFLFAPILYKIKWVMLAENWCSGVEILVCMCRFPLGFLIGSSDHATPASNCTNRSDVVRSMQEDGDLPFQHDSQFLLLERTELKQLASLRLLPLFQTVFLVPRRLVYCFAGVAIPLSQLGFEVGATLAPSHFQGPITCLHPPILGACISNPEEPTATSRVPQRKDLFVSNHSKIRQDLKTGWFLSPPGPFQYPCFGACCSLLSAKSLAGFITICSFPRAGSDIPQALEKKRLPRCILREVFLLELTLERDKDHNVFLNLDSEPHHDLNWNIRSVRILIGFCKIQIGAWALLEGPISSRPIYM